MIVKIAPNLWSKKKLGKRVRKMERETLRNSMKNQMLRIVGVSKDSGWTDACALTAHPTRTESCPVPGLSVEMLILLSEFLGFDYEMVWVPSFQHLEQYIVNGSADMSLNFLTSTPQQRERMSFMPATNAFRQGFMTRQPNGLNSDAPMLSPFKRSTWLALASVFLTVVLAMVQSVGRSFGRLLDSVFRLLAFSLNQHNDWTRGGSAPRWLRMLVSHYAVFTLLVQIFYSSVLTAFLYPVPVDVPFQGSGSLAPLVASGSRRILVNSNSTTSYFSILNNSASDAHRAMQQALKEAKLVTYSRNSEAVPMLLADPMLVLPISSLNYRKLMGRKCGVKYVRDDTLYDMYESAVLQKHSPFLNVITKAFNFVHPVFWQVAQQRYHANDNELAMCDSNYVEQKSVGIDALKLLFFFWAGGCVVGLCAFVVELYLGSYSLSYGFLKPAKTP